MQREESDSDFGSGRLGLVIFMVSPPAPEPNRSEELLETIGTSWKHSCELPAPPMLMNGDIDFPAAFADDCEDFCGLHSSAWSEDCSTSLGSLSSSDDGSENVVPNVPAGALEGCCNICYESFAHNDQLTALPCSVNGLCHSVWHTDCIRGWLKSSPGLTCPLCRVDHGPEKSDSDCPPTSQSAWVAVGVNRGRAQTLFPFLQLSAALGGDPMSL
jgi:hypothetical protein